MAVNASAIKALREKSGAGVMECKKALEESDGDSAKAEEILRLMSAATASKKSSRETTQGRIASYIHGPGRIGVLLELRCESDFVADSDEFKALVKDICMQVAATSPIAISEEEIPEDIIAFHKEKFKEEVKDKPAQIVEKILEGKLKNLYKEMVLLHQPFIKDTSMSIDELIKANVGKLKENISIGRFVRYEIGE